ncbi:Eukaryotic translation initiation factor 3 subunit D [Acorus calamus]|uniref:Eukaryotic translation initiation factor 3 subunit D n=1 Tax=Acorus calamus TaxID=4465 RepID=A0AAV9DAC2_ACOCL|nr:Eukaryotic translation initiation factor 3 subunit D [Acorus calamus]
MVFEIGAVPFNPDGWGPLDTSSPPPLSNHLSNVPFAPFSRSDKLGRIADWTRNYNPSSASRNHPHHSVFDFALDDPSSASPALTADEDPSFRLVDGKPPPRPRFGPRWRFNPNHNRPNLPQRRDDNPSQSEKDSRGGGGAGGQRSGPPDRRPFRPYGPNFHPRREAAVLKSSVDIQPEWTMLEQIPFSTFTKLSYSVPDPPEDLLVCGALEFYDRGYDRVNPRSGERRLERFKSRNFFKVTTTDDPVVRRLANEDRATVFATDTILSALMCAPRSAYSWDVVVQRVGNKLFFDKRDGSQLDLLSVNETSQEQLPDSKDDINSAHSLSVEAAYINQNFSQQVLVRDGNKVTFDEPNPFASEGEEVASVAYRYRRWKLDDDLYLVSRCEVHAISDNKGQRSFLTLNALNEFDPKYTGVDWRQKLETQRGAVLATELKNNANKLAKWTAQAMLGGADLMKIGYVSRTHPRDHYNHAILSVVGYKPREFAAQINLNPANMWGIVKSVVDLCMKLNEGKYVIVKDPMKPQVRIYEVPPDAFENEYVEEPLPEEEQVQPPAEDQTDGASAEVAVGDAVAVAASVEGGGEKKEVVSEA